MVVPLTMRWHRPIQYFNVRIDRLFSKKLVLRKDTKKTDEINDDVEEPDLYVERVRLEKMELRL